jgi:hypothetical protein
MLPEIFTHTALDAIARDSPAGDAHTDRKPEAWMLEPVQSRAHEEERVG